MNNQDTLLKINNLEVSKIIYKSCSGDYKIISFTNYDSNKDYIVKGEMNINEYEFVNLILRQAYDPKHGVIFEVVSYEKIIPSDKKQFIKNFFNLLEKNSEK